MAGLAIGAALPAIVDRAKAISALAKFSSARSYALLELTLAVWGCFTPALLSAGAIDSLASATAANTPLSYLARIIIAALILLPPTALMGLAFPLTIKWCGQLRQGHVTELLYAVNTGGAVLGATAAAFWLMPTLGVFMTSACAAGLNLVAAGTAFLVSSMVPDGGPSVQPISVLPEKSKQKTPTAGALTSLKCVLIGAFLAGFFALAFEVTWTRFFSLLLGSSVFSFSTVLAMFLGGLGIGAMLVLRVLARANQPLLFIASGLAFSAVYTVTLLFFADELPWLFLSIAQSLIHVIGRFSFEISLVSRFITIAICVAPPAVAFGVVLPLFFRATQSGLPEANRGGLIYAVNTAGGIFGALITGFVLIPGLSLLTASGLQSTALIICSGQIFLASWIFLIWSKSFVSDEETRMIVNGVVLFLIVAVVGDIAFFRPGWNPRIMSAGATFYMPADIAALTRESFLRSIGVDQDSEQSSKNMLFYRDGLNATVTVDRNAAGSVIYLKNDGKVEAALPSSLDRPNQSSDISTHVLLGALPALVHLGPCNRALVIGYGSGTTAGAALSFPEVKHLDIAELEPAIFEASSLFKKLNNDPLRQEWITNGRVVRLSNDGRFVLSTSAQPYDVIISQPADPWVNGSSELFTEEFWQLGKSRLNPDGVFCQWIQLYSLSPRYFGILCRTFHEVFPAAFLFHSPRAGECVLVGFNGKSNFDPASMDTRFASASDQTLLKSGGLSSHAQLSGLTRLDWSGIKKMCAAIAAQTGDARTNTDDNLLVEYAAARNALTQDQNIETNIGFIQKFAGQ